MSKPLPATLVILLLIIPIVSAVIISILAVEIAVTFLYKAVSLYWRELQWAAIIVGFTWARPGDAMVSHRFIIVERGHHRPKPLTLLAFLVLAASTSAGAAEIMLMRRRWAPTSRILGHGRRARYRRFDGGMRPCPAPSFGETEARCPCYIDWGRLRCRLRCDVCLLHAEARFPHHLQAHPRRTTGHHDHLLSESIRRRDRAAFNHLGDAPSATHRHQACPVPYASMTLSTPCRDRFSFYRPCFIFVEGSFFAMPVN